MSGTSLYNFLAQYSLFAVGCLLICCVGGCTMPRSVRFSTTVCGEPGSVSLLYTYGGDNFQILDSDGDKVAITGNQISVESLFSAEDVFTTANTSSVALDASILLKWDEEGTDYQLVLSLKNDCPTCEKKLFLSAKEISVGSLVDFETSEVAGGTAFEVLYLDVLNRLRTLKGTLVIDARFASVTVDLVSYSCQLDCETDVSQKCECNYSCNNGLSGFVDLSEDSQCEGEDIAGHAFRESLHTTCTVNSLSVTSPYRTFDINLE